MRTKFRQIVVVFGLCLLAGAAPAEVSQQGGQQLDAAYSALASLIQQKQAKGEVPRLSDPADAKVLEAWFDSVQRLGRPPYIAKDVPALIQALERQQAVMVPYLQLAASTPGNDVALQSEIIRSMAGLFTLFGAALPALDDFIGKLKPEEINNSRRQGLRQMRLGLKQMVSGAAQTLRTPGITPDNLMKLTESLSQNAPAIAKASTKADRAVMLALMQAALRVLSVNAQATMKDFVAAMSGTACEGLCKLE